LEGFGYSDLGFGTAVNDALDDLDWIVEGHTCFWFWFLAAGGWSIVS
jgi:hypothetical protein